MVGVNLTNKRMDVHLFSEGTVVVSTGDRNIGQILKTKWWQYLVMGLADVEANYAVVKAYQFTTLTSIQVRETGST